MKKDLAYRSQVLEFIFRLSGVRHCWNLTAPPTFREQSFGRLTFTKSQVSEQTWCGRRSQVPAISM